MTDAQRIAQLEAELATVHAEMQSFAYTVSHDLRAPLRHIVSYAQLVQEDAGPQLSPEVQGFLATITDSAKHLGIMLDGLLELSRIGTAPVQLTAVPLQTLVHDVVQEVQRQCLPGRSIDWRIAATLPTVLADTGMLRQALQHVLGNAVKFTARKDAAVIDISAHVDLATGRVTLSVQDNGAGFNPAMVSKLFQPFARLHSTKQFAGLGMGLALVRKHMQRLGGDVSATAQVDGGCTVCMVLPVG